MAKLSSLDDLLVHELQDIYDAEHQILKALPKMIDATNTPELKDAFQLHLRQTEGHVRRLEEAFRLLGKDAKREKCAGMAGIIAEGDKMMGENMDLSVLDAAIISAAQKVEHYEIAAYGTLAALAKQLGYKDALPLLLETLKEEKATDEKLTMLAKSGGNAEAAQQSRAA